MSEHEWEQFFTLMDKIIRGGKPWKDKAQEVKDRAEASDANFEEFLGWFGGDLVGD